MKSNLIAAVALLAALSGWAAPAMARHDLAAAAPQAIELKDGGTLYVFGDGKMAKESRFGRAEYLTRGEVLETADGRRVNATSNEVARLAYLLISGHGN